MDEVHPILKKLFIATIVLYVIATAYMFSDIYISIERINHFLLHIKGIH